MKVSRCNNNVNNAVLIFLKCTEQADISEQDFLPYTQVYAPSATCVPSINKSRSLLCSSCSIIAQRLEGRIDLSRATDFIAQHSDLTIYCIYYIYCNGKDIIAPVIKIYENLYGVLDWNSNSIIFNYTTAS